MSVREAALAALFAQVKGSAGTAVRGDAVPERVPFGGLLIQRDGEAGDPEVTLSPPIYAWKHRVEVDLIVQVAAEDAPAALNVLLSAFGAAIAADPRLGGTVNWAEVHGPAFTEVPVTGAAPLTGATVPVILHYDSTSPLG